jgi:hypothetical protein
LGGPIDGGNLPVEPGDPGTPGGPPVVDPGLLYEGQLLTSYWKYDDGSWYGFIDADIRTGMGANGAREPTFFTDGVRKLVEVTVWRQQIGKVFVTQTYVSINGYEATPIGTPDEPITFRVGTITLIAATRAEYAYTSGKATWRWQGDKFNIASKTGLVLPVEIRKAT